MNLIRLAIERPIAVIAGVVMVVMFGWMALQSIPIQLTPDISRPVIQVSTGWPGASPYEVEREILIPQENALRGLDGLVEMRGEASFGGGSITLEFAVGTEMDRALLLASNRLDGVSGYPEEASEPFIATAEGGPENAVAWFILTRAPGNLTPMNEYGQFVEDVIVERIRRVDGVADAGFFGGTPREMQVIVDPDSMARFGITVSQLLAALRAADVSITAGTVEEGKRAYVVRTDGEFDSLDRVRDVPLRSIADQETGALGRVTLTDVATVRFAYAEPEASIRFLGEEAIAINAQRETGANVIAVLSDVEAAIAELAAGPVAAENLRIVTAYRASDYIESAIDLVLQNILVGGGLAAAVLLVFLRSGRATLVVSLAIPVSVIGSFVAMAALGRSLNVISLAGIAFAVGMVVDAAIVVLENIFRLRQAGLDGREAAYEGARQVWGAVLVSSLTTVMVFIPILVMELEVGQLFRDIAVAISVSVLLSLLVAVTLIPALASRLLAGEAVSDTSRRLPLPVFDPLARAFAWSVTGFARTISRFKVLALLVVGAVATACVLVTIELAPEPDYLPQGDQNFIAGSLIPPPGYNLQTMTETAGRIEGALRPLFITPGAAPGDGEPSAEAGPVLIESFFMVVLEGFGFMGVTATDERRVAELIPQLQQVAFLEPGTISFFSQVSLFGGGLGGTRTISIDIGGGELETIIATAQEVATRLATVFPPQEGHQFRPVPGLEFGSPEVHVRPNPLRLADNGVTAQELGLTVDAYNGGMRVAEITVEGERLDLMLRGPEGLIARTQEIGAIPVVTRSGAIVPVSSLAEVVSAAGPTAIRRLERQRTVSLILFPREDIPLEEAIATVESEILEPMRAAGLPPGVRFDISGTADELTRTWERMQWDLALAVVIVYLVMAVLFESFVYPLIILISVPLAAAGGLFGLHALNLYLPAGRVQNLDMLTMLGFVILVGIVVNNAILLVHQALFHRRQEGMDVVAAIVEATRNRIRPIFMSTLTSIFGMAPLVFFPGAGSELYRGLGSVVLGGLALSAVLTLLIVPPLLAVFMGLIERGGNRQAERQQNRLAGSQAGAAGD